MLVEVAGLLFELSNLLKAPLEEVLRLVPPQEYRLQLPELGLGLLLGFLLGCTSGGAPASVPLALRRRCRPRCWR